MLDFFRWFEGEMLSYWNFPYKTKLVDTKNDNFSGENSCQSIFFFPTWNHRQKNKRNEVYGQKVNFEKTKE